MRTTGTIHEVPCPFCGKPINIKSAKILVAGRAVTCRKCKQKPTIEKVWLQDDLWEMVSLTDLPFVLRNKSLNVDDLE